MADNDPSDDGPKRPASHRNGRLPETGLSSGDLAGGEGDQPERRFFGMEDLDEDMSIALIEDAHSLPGIYPVVVIAARGDTFRATLVATVELEQQGDPFTITHRESSQGNFISYRVELHVESGRDALQRKSVLAALEGVVAVF